MVSLLSVSAAAAQLDCSAGHVYNLIASGQLRAVEIKTADSGRSKTRVRVDDLDAFVEAMTRGDLAAPVARAAAERARVVHPGDRRDRERSTYSTPEAAAYAEVGVQTVLEACRAGRLHGTRATPRGRWRIDHECLVAWMNRRPCGHQDGGAGEARRDDGT